MMSQQKKEDKEHTNQATGGLSGQENISPWTVEPEKPPASGTQTAGQAEAPNASSTQTAPPAAETPQDIEILKKKAAERDEYLDLLQRTRADYLNFIKRAQKDRAETIKYGIQEFAEKVVGVMDDFARAIASAEKSKDFDTFLEGVKLIESQFRKVLAEAGITPIESVGKAFDPALHEAIMQEETTQVPEGTILEELQRGYMIKDRVLRAARVKVARKPASQPSSQQLDSQKEEKKQ